MGQQQLLLIVLGVIIVGIAIVMGINLFRQSSIDHKRDLVVNEVQNLAAMAVEYYKKPSMLGGGGNKFTGWDIPDNLKITDTGSYEADVQNDRVIITGTGNDVVSGNDSVKVEATVWIDSMATTILN